MKKLILTFIAALTILTMMAQAPQEINYQGVARDNTGAILATQPIGLRITIHQTTATGPTVYQETHSTTTNQFGLFNITVGSGTVVSGSFSSIDWGTDSYFIEVEMDETGGTSYQPMGTSQLVSVPYALYAETSGTAGFNPNFPDGAESLNSVHIIITSSSPYTVPSGTNFHTYIEAPDYLNFPFIINGQSINGFFWNRIILTGGDIISTTATTTDKLYVSGYTSPQKTQPVYIDIVGGFYTVPTGKQFYLTWLNVIPWSGGAEIVYVDGVAIMWEWLVWERSTSAYLVIDEGSTITTNASGGTKVFLNGFLK